MLLFIPFYKVDTEDLSSKEMGNRKKVMSVLLEPRSLLVVKDDLYERYLHSIDELKTDELSDLIVNLGDHKVGDILHRQNRISLTIRHVPKTSKATILLSRRL